jgi:hypothetical protein
MSVGSNAILVSYSQCFPDTIMCSTWNIYFANLEPISTLVNSNSRLISLGFRGLGVKNDGLI